MSVCALLVIVVAFASCFVTATSETWCAAAKTAAKTLCQHGRSSLECRTARKAYQKRCRGSPVPLASTDVYQRLQSESLEEICNQLQDVARRGPAVPDLQRLLAPAGPAGAKQKYHSNEGRDTTDKCDAAFSQALGCASQPQQQMLGEAQNGACCTLTSALVVLKDATSKNNDEYRKMAEEEKELKESLKQGGKGVQTSTARTSTVKLQNPNFADCKTIQKKEIPAFLKLPASRKMEKYHCGENEKEVFSCVCGCIVNNGGINGLVWNSSDPLGSWYAHLWYP